MNGKNWERVAELFGMLSEVGAEERAGCGRIGRGEAEVRAEVESLLAEHDRAGVIWSRGYWGPETGGGEGGVWRLEEVVGEGDERGVPGSG